MRRRWRLNARDESGTRRERLESLCHRAGVAILYVFGRRADEVSRRLRDDTAPLPPGPTDVDIAARFVGSTDVGVDRRVDLAIAMEDLLGVNRVVVVDLDQADAFLAANAIRGNRLYAQDERSADEHDLCVPRRAGGLAPLERQRLAVMLERAQGSDVRTPPMQPPAVASCTRLGADDEDACTAFAPTAHACYRELLRPTEWGPLRCQFRLQGWWSDPHLVSNVNVVPFVGERCLVVRLRDGGCEVPGGTLEPGEHYLQAVRRELEEEAGAKLIEFVPFGAWHCHSSAQTRYRPHLPHPQSYRLVGYGSAEVVAPPQPVAGGEEVASVLAVTPEEAASLFRSGGRADLGDLYLMAAALRASASAAIANSPAPRWPS